MNKATGWLSVWLWLLPATAVWAGEIAIRDPWVRETPPTLQSSAAYMIIHNTGQTGKTVVGASSPLFARLEFHETIQRDGMATMVARDSLVIDAGGQVTLKPGGYHMMLLGHRGPKPLRAGDKVPLALHLSDGSRVTAEAEVRATSSGAAEQHPGHHHAH
ncbi:MAG: copper chaperone PCu(A)C [Magnetococcus sp. DMHC-8]